MKITEQKTKSLTFIFNKDEEFNDFIEILFHGIDYIEQNNACGVGQHHEVVESIRRNILNGIPREPKVQVSDANGPWYKNDQGQWNPLPQGTGGSPVKMPTTRSRIGTNVVLE